MRRAAWLAALLTAGGCAPSAFPAATLQSVNRAVTTVALRADPAAFVGQRVIVGGEVLATRPGPGETEIEVLSRRLTGDDSPERTDTSDGRFIVKTPEFLDPAVYAEGRRVTVVGAVTGSEERKIGDLPYRYPVLSMHGIKLWPRDPPAPPFYPGYPYPLGWYYYYPYPRPWRLPIWGY